MQVVIDKVQELINGLSDAKLMELSSSMSALATTEGLELYENFTPPVPIEEWVTDPYYIGKDTFWPKIQDDLVEFFTGPFVELLITGGKRSGKSYITVGALKRMIYVLSCFVSPQHYFQLAPTSKLFGVNFSIGGWQAQAGIYSELRASIEETPYFQDKFSFLRKIESEMRFPKRFSYIHGSGLTQRELGLNMLFGCFDEVNSVQAVQNSKRAKDLSGEFHQVKDKYDVLCRRARETAMLDTSKTPLFKMIALGSREYEGDFMEQRMEQFKDDPQTMIREYSAFETRPKSHFMPGRFLVDLGGTFEAPKIIENADEATGRVLIMPENYKRDAETDLPGLLRDAFGVIAGGGDNLFFENQEKVRLCFRRPLESHPFSQEVTDYRVTGSFNVDKIFTDNLTRKVINPRAPRFIHIDMARSGDDIGFVMGHCSGWMDIVRLVDDDPERVFERTETLPTTYIDFSLQILPNGKDVDPALVRNLVHRLKDLGYNIQMISGDDYAFSSLIELRRSNFNVELLVVTNGMSCHNVFKTAVYDQRFDAYEYPIGFKQMCGMRIKPDGSKVEKPASGLNSGVENAYCGVVWWVNQKSVRSAPTSPDVSSYNNANSLYKEMRASTTSR